MGVHKSPIHKGVPQMSRVQWVSTKASPQKHGRRRSRHCKGGQARTPAFPALALPRLAISCRDALWLVYTHGVVQDRRCPVSIFDRVTKAVGDAVDRGKKEVDQFVKIQKINGQISEIEKSIGESRTQIQQVKVKIGEMAIEMLQAGTLASPAMKELLDQIAGIDQQIAASEAEIAQKKAEIESIKAEDKTPKAAPPAAAAPPEVAVSPVPPPPPVAAPPVPQPPAVAEPPVPPPPPPQARFCSQCGAAAPSGAFCVQCGTKLA
jgi:hypothetical protein